MDKPFGVGVGFGTTALLSAAVCAALVGYVGWSQRRLRPLPAPASS